MTTILNTTPELVDPDTVTPYPDNYRQGDIGAIATSITMNGWWGHIIVQKSSRRIIAGNHRYLAAVQLGMTEIPALILDITDDQADTILLADNRTSDLASDNITSLATILQSIVENTGTLTGTGYDTDDLDDLLHQIASDDPATTRTDPGALDPPEKPTTKPGDIIRLGNHTLICGDASLPAAWATVTTPADLVWTDPPYGVEYAGDVFAQAATGEDSRDRIQNDGTADASITFTGMLFHLPTRPGTAWYVAAPAGPALTAFLNPLTEKKILHQCLIWRKHRMTPGRSDYHYQHEMILYGWTPGAAHLWNSDRKQTSVLEYDRPHASPHHPTSKPVDLVAYCIRNSSLPGQHIIDPFAGGGSTLIACEETNRRCTAIEISPAYCDTIISRWEQTTGRTVDRTE